MTSEPTLLSDLVPRSARSDPAGVAVTCDRETLTWEQLDGRVGRLAAALVDTGVRPGDRVGIYLHRSLESLVAVHGILRSGAAYVPIDPMAPTTTVDRIVADCGIRVLVTHEPRRAGVRRLTSLDASSTVIGLDGPIDGDGTAPAARIVPWAEVEGGAAVAPVAVLPDDLAYIMYTSGSTGTPKGIMHTHRSGLAYATMSAELYGLGPEDRMANFSPLHFDMSTFEVLAGVGAGARVVLIPEPHLRLPASLTELIAEQGCTTLYTVPSLFQQMMTRGALADRDLSAVRWVLPAGEVFPPEPLRELVELMPNARFSNVYGPAEVNQITYHHFDLASLDADTLPIGSACRDVELRVVDDADRLVRAGERGELLAAAPTMMRGYWGRPDLDERGFHHTTEADGTVRRWYRTGDLVSVDPAGLLRYHGRRDNQVKIRGNRVELESVEAAVGSLDGVEHAVVGVRPLPGGDDQLVARYTASEPTDPGRWRAALANRLPVYAIPSAYEQADAFPLTPSGKIDRRTVREQIATEPTADGT